MPGGRVEIGETLVSAVTREIQEETGLAIDVRDLAGYREIIREDEIAGRGRHFVILPFAARWIEGEVHLNEELSAFRWLPPQAVRDLPTTDGLLDIIEAAQRLARL